jgi:phage terminase large subunit GpA-like protein
VKQLVAEQLMTVKTRRGFTRLEWQKLRERNEALDCRVYARAAAWIAGIDRWSERKWQELERQLGIETKPQPPPVPQPTATDVHSRRPADTAQPRQASVVRMRPSGWLGHRQRDWLRRQ